MRQIVAEVKSVHFPSFSWVHDFPATQNWAVVPQTPCVWSMGVSQLSAVQLRFPLTVRSHGRPGHVSTVLQAALGFSKAQFAMFDWRPELGSTLDLVSLDGDVNKNRRFKAPAFMAVHYINSEQSIRAPQPSHRGV